MTEHNYPYRVIYAFDEFGDAFHPHRSRKAMVQNMRNGEFLKDARGDIEVTPLQDAIDFCNALNSTGPSRARRAARDSGAGATP